MSLNLTDTDALRRVREVWDWALRSNRPYFAYLLGAAIIAFEMDRGPGNFVAPGAAKGVRPEILKKPKRGRPPKQHP
jgi:hypothetical protein